MTSHTILSLVLILATFANARFLGFPVAVHVSTDVYELVCAQGTTADMCLGIFGTNCTTTGEVQNSGTINDICSPAYCFCRLIAPVPCKTESDGEVRCQAAATSNSPAPPGVLTTESPSEISAGLAVLSSMAASVNSFLDTALPAFYSDGMFVTQTQAPVSLTALFPAASATSSSSAYYDGPAAAVKMVYVTVTERHHHHHHNGTSSHSYTGTGSNCHHNGTSTHFHHQSSVSGLASGSGQHNGTRTFSRLSRSSSLPSFSTLSELPLTPSHGFAATPASRTTSSSKASLASTSKMTSALTTSGGYYD